MRCFHFFRMKYIKINDHFFVRNFALFVIVFWPYAANDCYYFYYFKKQNNWNWVIPHQLSLFIALGIFLFDLILLAIAAIAPFNSKFIRFTCDWLELDVTEKENITKIVITECIISAIFAGKNERSLNFSPVLSSLSAYCYCFIVQF